MPGLEKHALQTAPLGRQGLVERGDAFSELPVLKRGWEVGWKHRAGLEIQQAFLQLRGRGEREPPGGFTDHLAGSQAPGAGSQPPS